MTKKVLMIDDDPDFVSGIRSILTAANFDVDVAYTPKDGMQSLQTKQYDLLLLEWLPCRWLCHHLSHQNLARWRQRQ